MYLARKMPFLRKTILSEEENEQLLIVQLRDHFNFLGLDVSKLSDAELKKRLLVVSNQLACVGSSFSQLSEALHILAASSAKTAKHLTASSAAEFLIKNAPRKQKKVPIERIKKPKTCDYFTIYLN